MNIVILSRNINLYSTRRLIEEAHLRNHQVEVIDPLECDLIIEKEKPTILYRDTYLDNIDAIIPRIGASSLMTLATSKIPKPNSLVTPQPATICGVLGSNH